MAFKLPNRGFVFWPVGNGDSTTIVVDVNTIIQVDLHSLACADNDEDPRTYVLDELVELLPKINGKPYLALFVLSHPDRDHCLGFEELAKRVTIGEFWFSPRIFWEYSIDLCPDAIAFQKEAKRRVKKTIESNGRVGSGDRVRIIGYADVLEKDDYRGFPADGLSIPGHTVSIVDGADRATDFSAFIHAPFKDDSEGQRNETSVAMQATLKNGDNKAQAMLLGDLSYPTLKRIFDISDDDDLKWQVFLAPHHCSKSAMYWKESNEENEQLKQDILNDIGAAAEEVAYIVSSSDPIPEMSSSGDNPPHARAANRYREIAPTAFLCTQEHPDVEDPEPIAFELSDTGLKYVEPSKKPAKSSAGLAEAVTLARGTQTPPRDRVGFGGENDGRPRARS